MCVSEKIKPNMNEVKPGEWLLLDLKLADVVDDSDVRLASCCVFVPLC